MAHTFPVIPQAAFAFAIMISAAAAGEAKMTGPEITEALTGNTVQGVWGSTEYRSYFDPSGTTIYATRRGQDVGRWNVKGDRYCSVWERSGESCYDLLRDGDQIIWIVPASGKRYPSTLVKGKALGF